MTAHIYRYDKTPLVSIPDGQLNTSQSSLNLPGNNYANYGEKVVEDLIYLLENFAGPNPPTGQLLRGQLWYNTNSVAGASNEPVGIQVWDGSNWVGTGRVLFTNSQPSSTLDGQLWYNPSKRQLFAYDKNLPSSNRWALVGPLAASDYTKNPSVTSTSTTPSNTTVDVVQLEDDQPTPVVHSVIRLIVKGVVVATISNDADFIPNTSMTGFGKIYRGITLNQSISATFAGLSSSASLADSATNLVGLLTSNIMRKDATNEPTENNSFDLGSIAYKYANVWATTFNGTATTALYADLAERYEADDFMDEGTVVVIGGEKEITRVNQMGSPDVFGVISTKPALALNCGAGDDRTHPYVALAGRVPVKVVGPVSKGSRLMASSLPGIAQKWEPEYGILAIVGRALTAKTSNSVELIEATIGTRG